MKVKNEIFFNNDYPSEKLDEDLIIAKAGEDLTYLAARGKITEIYQREKEIEQIIKILGMRKKGNPILLGEAGVGKTVMVNYLALKIIRKEVPQWLRGCKIIRTSFVELWSQVKNTDNPWPEYGKILGEAIEFFSENPVILFMDEIHMIFEYPISMSIMKPPLAEGKIRLIGVTTPRDFQRFITKDEATARRFEPVYIKEPSSELTKKILLFLKKELENFYGLSVSDDVIDYTISCADNYIHHRYRPDKSIVLLERASINASYEGKNKIEKSDIEKALTDITGIPEYILKESKDRFFGLEAALNYHVLGQEEVISKVAKRLLITKAKVNINPNRPNGVFLLTGPTGVGKLNWLKLWLFI